VECKALDLATGRMDGGRSLRLELVQGTGSRAAGLSAASLGAASLGLDKPTGRANARPMVNSAKSGISVGAPGDPALMRCPGWRDADHRAAPNANPMAGPGYKTVQISHASATRVIFVLRA
jgi:hypothetical protein